MKTQIHSTIFDIQVSGVAVLFEKYSSSLSHVPPLLYLVSHFRRLGAQLMGTAALSPSNRLRLTPSESRQARGCAHEFVTRMEVSAVSLLGP